MKTIVRNIFVEFILKIFIGSFSLAYESKWNISLIRVLNESRLYSKFGCTKGAFFHVVSYAAPVHIYVHSLYQIIIFILQANNSLKLKKGNEYLTS